MKKIGIFVTGVASGVVIGALGSGRIKKRLIEIMEVVNELSKVHAGYDIEDINENDIDPEFERISGFNKVLNIFRTSEDSIKLESSNEKLDNFINKANQSQ